MPKSNRVILKPFLLISYASLTASFLLDDFSVDYVARNSNSMLPWYYKFTAVWGSHEGSVLLWSLILSGWGFAVSLFSRQLPRDIPRPASCCVVMLISPTWN